MKSLKKFKKLIIEGKESPLQLETKITTDLKVPEIRQSAYKILHRKKNRESNQSTQNQHSISKKQKMVIPSQVSSPLKKQKKVLKDISSTIQNTQSSLYKTCSSKTSLLQLTQQELNYLSKMVDNENGCDQNRLKIHEKINELKKNLSRIAIASPKQHEAESTIIKKHHDSDHGTQILSVPQSLEDFTDKIDDQSTILRSKFDDINMNDFTDKSDLEFKKIMYILESKSRAISIKKQEGQIKIKQPMNNYRLIQQITTPSISFRGQNRQPQKKAQLMEIVSMLNTKYKKNIKFN